jgi:16S rRNA (adenine1518-N6/adenine1519-N6)-dimethyltransferase
MNLPSTSQLVQQHKLITKKNLGQNFIFDHNFTRKIVSSTGDLEQQLVLEIGPGPGCLTRSILEQPIKGLVCVEKDARCLPILTQIQEYFPKLTIVCEDALLLDENQLFNGQKFKIIANLPYNIGTVLVFKWLKNLKNIISMHLMLQKEVAERIVAQANTQHYCRLSANINLLCQTKILYLVHNSRIPFTHLKGATTTPPSPWTHSKITQAGTATPLSSSVNNCSNIMRLWSIICSSDASLSNQ